MVAAESPGRLSARWHERRDVKSTYLDEILAAVPEDLVAQDGARLRELKDLYQQCESGVSYVRRIVQGRLDIVEAEQERRSPTPQTSDGSDDAVLEQLPATLAQRGRGPGTPRPPIELEPPAFAEDMLVTIDESSPADVGSLASLDGPTLVELEAHLRGLESELSTTRQELHRIIDLIHAEIIQRYRSGELTVDSLLVD